MPSFDTPGYQEAKAAANALQRRLGAVVPLAGPMQDEAGAWGVGLCVTRQWGPGYQDALKAVPKGMAVHVTGPQRPEPAAGDDAQMSLNF